MSIYPLLCLDISTPVGSFALLGEQGLLARRSGEDPAQRAERLYTIVREMLESCALAPSGLGAVAVAAGPGSFTGLRIAASTAKTLAWAEGKPLFAAGSLKSLAYGAAEPGLPVCASFDAGQRELYAACYQWPDLSGPAQELLAPCVLSVEQMRRSLSGLAADRKIICAGQGFRKWENELLSGSGGSLQRVPENLDLPDAACLGRLVLSAPELYRVEEAGTFEPFYVRVGQAALRLKQ